MNSPLPVRIVDSAARAIEEAAKWWTTNRPKAPDAFVVDFENALKLIASHPGKARAPETPKWKMSVAFTWLAYGIICTTE